MHKANELINNDVVEHNHKVIICVGTQKASTAKRSPRISSKLVDSSKQALRNIMDKCEDMTRWVAGHSNLESNEIADEQAREGSFVEIGDAETSPRPSIINFFCHSERMDTRQNQQNLDKYGRVITLIANKILQMYTNEILLDTFVSSSWKVKI